MRTTNLHKTLWASVLGTFLLGFLSACGDDGTSGGKTDTEQPNDPKDSDDDPSSIVQGVRFHWNGALAVAVGNLTEAAPNALTSTHQTLFRIEDDGTVAPALEAPVGMQMPEVQFVARSPLDDYAYVSFRTPLQVPSSDPEQTSNESIGSFFRVAPDGTMKTLIAREGRVLAPLHNPDADISEEFQHAQPYHFDEEGNIYVIWSSTIDTTGPRRLHRYRPADDALDVIDAAEDEILQVDRAVMSADRSTLIVSGTRTYLDQITDQGVPLRQSFIQLHRLTDFDAPVEILSPEDDLAAIAGMQISPDGGSVYFHGYLLGDLSGIGRLDVAANGDVSSTLLYSMLSAHAPINHTTTHEGDYVDGFFEPSWSDNGDPPELLWTDRWFVGGDRASGELDYDAVLAHVAHLFATPVTFSYGGLTGEAGLQSFLEDEPYAWEVVQGVPAPETFTSIYDDYYGWHFLEQHFVDATTEEPATTVASFLEEHGLANDQYLAYYSLNVSEIFFDAEGALFSIVKSDWNEETQRFRLMQPLRILDADGNRALSVLPAIADADFSVDAYRLGTDGRHVFLLARLPGEDASGEVHRIYRFDPSLGEDAVLEDMMAPVEGAEITAFAVSNNRLYFVGESTSGFIDLETLAFTPFDDSIQFTSIQAL